MIRRATVNDASRIKELYVDHFFQNCGIGSERMAFAIKRNCRYLWVLEKNTDARRFYERRGFTDTGKRRLEEGTTEYLVEMKWQKPILEVLEQKHDCIFPRL